MISSLETTAINPFLNANSTPFPPAKSNVDEVYNISSALDISTNINAGISTVNTVTSYRPLEHPMQTATPKRVRKVRYKKKHLYKSCGKLFDRLARARDHEYQDSGETPYHSKTQCGDDYWYVILG